jgi:hypothetical protein
MAEQVWAVRDVVWEAVEPLLPPRAPQTTARDASFVAARPAVAAVR